MNCTPVMKSLHSLHFESADTFGQATAFSHYALGLEQNFRSSSKRLSGRQKYEVMVGERNHSIELQEERKQNAFSNYVLSTVYFLSL